MSTTPRTDAEIDDVRNVALEFTCRNPPPQDGENLYVVPASFAAGLEREINLLTDEVADLKKQLKDNLAAFKIQHDNYVELCGAVMGGGCRTSEVHDVFRLATEQRELAEMFRENPVTESNTVTGH